MTWLNWLLPLAAGGVNLHALAALVLSRGKAGPELRGWARRSGWLAGALVVLVGVGVVIVVRGTPTDSADPAAQASRWVNQLVEGINCAAFGALASALPVVVALWMGGKVRRT